MKAPQESLSREIKRKEAKKRQVAIHERWAQKEGYKLTKEAVKPGKKKVEEAKKTTAVPPAATGTKPFI